MGTIKNIPSIRNNNYFTDQTMNNPSLGARDKLESEDNKMKDTESTSEIYDH